MAKFNRWCFTINNYTLLPAFDTSCMEYLCFGEETGESGTPHIQGYVRFKIRKTLASVKKLLDNRAHAEPAKGHEKQNRDYCSKDGKFHEFGTFQEDAGKKGHRSDLDEVTKDILQGMRFFLNNI